MALPAADMYREYPLVVMSMQGFLRDPSHHAAIETILTHVLNDVQSLWVDACSGRGRPAAHAARALYEHLVTYCDVAASATDADRYMEHRHVTNALIAERGIGLDLLNGDDKRKEKSRLARLGKTAVQARNALLAKYGQSFGRGWNPKDLRTRATAHGLDGRYDTYKILSSVIHGSSGGLVGTKREVWGAPVHRVGNDYQLAAFALLEGVRSFRELLDRIATSDDAGAWAAAHLRDITDAAVVEWPEFRRAALRVDNAMWPTVPPPPSTVAILAFYPSGRRWYMHDTVNDVIIAALAPATEPAVPQAILDSSMRYNPAAFEGRPMTAAFEGLRLTPRPGARPGPTEAILVPERLKRRQSS